MVVIFNLKNSQSFTLSLPTEEVFQVNGQNRPVKELPVVEFHSQVREMLTPKPLNTQLSVFLLVVFFPFQESSNLIVCQRYGFFSVLAAIIRESSNKQLVLRIANALPFIHQPNRVAPKASDSKYWQLIGHINTRKQKYDIFSRALLRLFSGHRSL